MIIAAIELKWNEFRQNILNRRNKRRNDQLSKFNGVRERVHKPASTTLWIYQRESRLRTEEALFEDLARLKPSISRKME